MNTESFESADSRENKYADNADNKAKTEKMFGIIEALLYVSGEPVSIVELGRKNCIGHPMQFGTTDAFLRKFGLRSLGELPPLPIHEEDGERETPQPDSSEATKNPSESADATGE